MGARRPVGCRLAPPSLIVDHRAPPRPDVNVDVSASGIYSSYQCARRRFISSGIYCESAAGRGGRYVCHPGILVLWAGGMGVMALQVDPRLRSAGMFKTVDKP